MFRDFAELCEKVKSTSKKTEKVALVAAFLKNLSDEELKAATTFLTGRVFPRGDPRDVNVGYSTIYKALLEVSGITPYEFQSIYLKYGDLGATAEEILSTKKPKLQQLFKKQLTILDVKNELEKLASITGKGSYDLKSAIIKGLFLDASPIEAKYIVKILTSELRIGLVEGLVEEAIASAFGLSLDKVRSKLLILNDISEVALLAKKGLLEQATLTPLRPISFMLADTAQSPAEIADYFRRQVYAEFKFDGIRSQIHKLGNKVRIFSRRLEDVTESFPDIVEAVKRLKHDLVLDGEILPFKDGKPLPFQLLQRRLHRKYLSREVLEEAPLVFFAYDLLYLDGKPLLDLDLRSRREFLEKVEMEEPLSTSEIYTVTSAKEIQELFDRSKQIGFEGLVVKDPLSQYTPGRRGKHWIKLKKELDTLDVVIVAAEYGHGKRAGILSDYIFAVNDNGVLKVIGKAYSGLTDDEMLELSEKLKSLMIEDLGYRVIVKPEIVLEVAFDSIQVSDRHDSGFALRFPRIKRIRFDKSVAEIDTLDKVKEIYMRQKVKL
ncbi:MAG: hypothetical protein DRJ33_01085 [Candidatus Methanomethylicota archaeon]|uniref:DNA ligase n=1 Tax=Thermoproteota archaeon TaxID=2056631 RepID=A0A497F2I8_9CREN|nr:MAG: hypothetical protein DRJ33_01085 [Candidatus Verstraetearchaeota archaeon]